MNRKEKAIGGKQLTEDKTILPKPTLLKMDLQYFSDGTPEEAVGEVTPPVEEVAEPAGTPEDKPEVDYEALVAQMANTVAVLNSKVDALETQTVETPEEVPTETPTEPDPQLAVYETALGGIVEEKLQGIPEVIAALMPDNLTSVEKLEWITKAEKAVPQEKPAEEPAETKVVIESIGKPTPVPTETAVDITKLSATQKMLHGIEAFFQKDNKGD